MYHFAEIWSPIFLAGSPISNFRNVSVRQKGQTCGLGPQSAIRKAVYSSPNCCLNLARNSCDPIPVSLRNHPNVISHADRLAELRPAQEDQKCGVTP